MNNKKSAMFIRHFLVLSFICFLQASVGAQDNSSIERLKKALQSTELIDQNPLKALSMCSKVYSKDSDDVSSQVSRVLVSHFNKIKKNKWALYSRRLVTDSFVNCVDISMDDRFIAAGTSSGKILLWDSIGNLIRTISCDTSEIADIRFNKDSNALFYYTLEDNQIKSIDLNGKFLYAIDICFEHWKYFEISPNGMYLLMQSADNEIMIRDIKGDSISLIHIEDSRYAHIIFSPDNSYFVVYNENQISTYDMKGKLIFKKRAHEDYISGVSISKSGNFIVTTSYQSGDNLKVWNRKGKLLANLKGQRGPAFNPEISPDENELLSIDEHDNAFLWDLKKKEGKVFVRNIENNNIEISVAVHFTPDGENVYSEYTGNKVFFWDLKGNLIQVLNENNTLFTNFKFYHNGSNFLTSGYLENSLVLWNMKDCKIQDAFSGKGNLKIDFPIEKNTFRINYINDSTAEIRNNSNKILGTFYGVDSDLCDFYFSPSGKSLIFRKDVISEYWSISEDTLTKIKKYPFTGWNIRYSMSDTMFIVYDNSDSVGIYKIDGSLINALRGIGDSNVFAFSPDNNFLATGSESFDVLIWNLKGEIVSTLKGQTGALHEVAFSPDGKYISIISKTVSGNIICNIWDLGGHLLGSYDISPLDYKKITWDKNSEFIFVYHDDETIEVLPAPWKLAQVIK